MGKQLFQRIVMPPKFLFIGNQGVYGIVSRLAKVQPLAHLLPRVSFFEPLVAVQGSRDEVVKVMDFLGVAEFTEHEDGFGVPNDRGSDFHVRLMTPDGPYYNSQSCNVLSTAFMILSLSFASASEPSARTEWSVRTL